MDIMKIGIKGRIAIIIEQKRGFPGKLQAHINIFTLCTPMFMSIYNMLGNTCLSLFSYSLFATSFLAIFRTAVSPDVSHPQLIPELKCWNFWYSRLGMLGVDEYSKS